MRQRQKMDDMKILLNIFREYIITVLNFFVMDCVGSRSICPLWTKECRNRINFKDLKKLLWKILQE